ncbi:tetratricopeptide repeat protein [Novilysobacter avium]|uniref:Tetratricopeptide repeat protein n=1 Tax=Novilysobacter avium TaxID=2781023 RepID=A0A7S6UJU9_9GAMM|nr:hypothetical protein [Lysobacter avium]QOW21627.1 hypothetical protein INQ42_10340 [Lysobacter avium]
MRAAADPRDRGARRWGSLALSALLAAALLWWHKPISEAIWPDTRIQQLQSDAARALQAGELSRPDGRGARELYEAALALDPDRGDTREGLLQVGEAALARANAQIDLGQLKQARASLQLAREMAMPRAAMDEVAARLERIGDSAGDIEQLIRSADAARAAGRLDGDDDAALPLYQQALALRPNDIGALEGREDALSDLLQRASQAGETGDLLAAATMVERASELDPGHIDLPRVVSLLASRAEQRLQKADADLRRGRLQRALEGYDMIARIQPGNEAAARGRLRVANAHAALSQRHAADFRIREAQQELGAAAAIAPDAPAVIEANEHLAQTRLLQARLQSDLPPAQQKKRVRELLEAAAAAEARGDLLSPPGDSAYDKLRTARAIAADDPDVIAMTRRLRPAAHACFVTALRRNQLATAGGCLDAYAVLEGEENSVHASRRQLALRWIAVGDERVGAGDLQMARRALGMARSLDPSADGLDAFSRRLERASVPPRGE